MRIAIYTRPTQSYGVLVIVDNIIRACQKKGIQCRHITTLADSLQGEVVLPYGTLETKEMINKGQIPVVALLVDAISLGVRKKFWKYTKVGQIFNIDYWYSLLRIFKWGYLDKYIAKRVSNIMLVSESDGEYMKRFNRNLNIIVCRNGVKCSNIKPHIPSDKLRLGILSSWNSVGSYQENNWFIRTYWNRYAKNHPNVELVIAGRGEFSNRFRGIPQIKVIGEVEELADFFSNIDIFLAVNPKGCGILNRCLDAFAYKVPVIGHKGSLTGFTYMNDSFLSFDTYKEFDESVRLLSENSDIMKRISDNAYRYTLSFNNWDTNMSLFIDQLQMIIKSNNN